MLKLVCNLFLPGCDPINMVFSWCKSLVKNRDPVQTPKYIIKHTFKKEVSKWVLIVSSPDLYQPTGVSCLLHPVHFLSSQTGSKGGAQTGMAMALNFERKCERKSKQVNATKLRGQRENRWREGDWRNPQKTGRTTSAKSMFPVRLIVKLFRMDVR